MNCRVLGCETCRDADAECRAQLAEMTRERDEAARYATHLRGQLSRVDAARWEDHFDLIAALRYGLAECERLRAAVDVLATALDPSRIMVSVKRRSSPFGDGEFVAVDMNAKVYDEAMDALARLRAVADGGGT